MLLRCIRHCFLTSYLLSLTLCFSDFLEICLFRLRVFRVILFVFIFFLYHVFFLPSCLCLSAFIFLFVVFASLLIQFFLICYIFGLKFRILNYFIQLLFSVSFSRPISSCSMYIVHFSFFNLPSLFLSISGPFFFTYFPNISFHFNCLFPFDITSFAIRFIVLLILFHIPMICFEIYLYLI